MRRLLTLFLLLSSICLAQIDIRTPFTVEKDEFIGEVSCKMMLADPENEHILAVYRMPALGDLVGLYRFNVASSDLASNLAGASDMAVVFLKFGDEVRTYELMRTETNEKEEGYTETAYIQADVFLKAALGSNSDARVRFLEENGMHDFTLSGELLEPFEDCTLRAESL